jgi:molybdate transport system permease protein
MSWQPLALSLEVAAVATLIAATVGVAVALVIADRRTPARDLIDALTTAPMVLPPTVLGYYVLVALGRNSALGRAFEAATGSSIVFTRTGAVVAAAIGSLPLVIKSARAALEGVEPTLLRAARTLGASPARTLFTVHLPLAARGLVAGVTLAFARALGDFGVTLMVAGDIPGETQTAALAIYDAIQAHREAEAVGMVLILTSVTIVALYAVNRLTRRRDG